MKNAEERRVDQVVSELNRYGIVVATLEETKWFGGEEYNVEGCIVLTAGQ